MSRFRKALLAAFAAALVASPAPAKKAGLGRPALPEEIAAWDIDVRPDGAGLPPGRGSVKQGEALYLARCASCHGEFGEGAGRWPALAGGHGSLRGEAPEKTIGSFWPYPTTAFDYIRRAMPYGDARSLSDDEVYAITAFLLHQNDVVAADFVLSKENFTTVRLPNEAAFYGDDREQAERHFWTQEPCMKNCKPDAKITGRARVIDVTPEDGNKGLKVE
ncbi:MAG: cytochrome c [Hyphomicrobiales bacterium]|uniref:c-type cytochrome n=1 Tax=Rhabdaerophilum calidifontis TaxID=2604328 RepID=UPI00123AD70B|nr:cytochrome c [Rhabdaerophilum calidifontis]MCA1998395.1 cytochrome c [Hyphomicrobiales bacterium]